MANRLDKSSNPQLLMGRGALMHEVSPALATEGGSKILSELEVDRCKLLSRRPTKLSLEILNRSKKSQ